jgi:hypothetical protein
MPNMTNADLDLITLDVIASLGRIEFPERGYFFFSWQKVAGHE